MTVDTRRRGVPTRYSDTQFRSRLEARWAAFFDLIGWEWVYEPFDAPDFIPDFLIQGPRPIVIEVGPCITAEDYVQKAEKGFQALAQMDSDHDYLVLGVSPLPDVENLSGNQTAGLLDEGYWRHPVEASDALANDHGFGPLTAADVGWGLWGRCLDCRRIVVSHESGSYDSRPCGFSGHSGGWPHPILQRTLFDQWAEAGNYVQWRRK